MKQHTKWFMSVLAVAGGLIIANSAQGQIIELGAQNNLGNVLPDGGILPSPTLQASGLEMAGGAGYYWGQIDLPVGNQNTFNPNDNTITEVYTINSPAAGTSNSAYAGMNGGAWSWSSFQPLISINGGSMQRYFGYDGYNLSYSPINGQNIANQDKGYSYNAANGQVTITAPLNATTYAGLQQGGTVTAFQLSLDAQESLPQGFDVTFDTIYLSQSAPEPGTLALIGLGAAGLLAMRRRK